LGLAIVRWIVQQHGGSVEVASKVGRGDGVHRDAAGARPEGDRRDADDAPAGTMVDVGVTA
jgi:light-regulated signal transduction histidine kinase (bacteriophytochrome)